MCNKERLFGKTIDELRDIANKEGLPAYTATQMAGWLYAQNASSIDEMTNLSTRARDHMKEHYEFGLASPATVRESRDGTRKYLFPCRSGKFVEAAYIPESNRNTLCLSSQAGCKMGCLFCMTGKQGFHGNLSAGEILNQIRSLPEREQITNLVYMGMGEPLDNLGEVLKSLEILTAPWGFAMSPRRITVSTIGIIPAMRRFIETSQAHLAVSLHTPFSEERRKLMPVEHIHPVREVLKVLREYEPGKQRRISFEYIMFKGLNDTPRHVRELVRTLHGLKCRINLIRFHPIPGTSLESSNDHSIEIFRQMLNEKGIITTLRASRGQDIQAACGLLSTTGLANPGE